MKILSIYPYTHISSAALMINGKIIAASPEERFNRVSEHLKQRGTSKDLKTLALIQEFRKN